MMWDDVKVGDVFTLRDKRRLWRVVSVSDKQFKAAPISSGGGERFRKSDGRMLGNLYNVATLDRGLIREAARREAYRKFIGDHRDSLIFSLTRKGRVSLKRDALAFKTFDKVRDARRALDRLCELLKA